MAGVFFFAGCQKADEKANDQPAAKIENDTVTLPANSPQKESIGIEEVKPAGAALTHLTGRLIWDDDVTTRVYTPVAGRVWKILTDIGQPIGLDQTLTSINSPDFGQAQADAYKAQADLKFSERTLKRTKDLLDHGAAAQKDVENAEDDFENKKSENERATARLKLYGAEVGAVDGLYPLKSPIAGELVEKNLNPGQEVRPDQILANDPNVIKPLFVISDPTHLWVLLDVSETDVAALKPGLPLRIYARGYPGMAFRGKLTIIGASLDPATRTVKARGEVDNKDRLLKAEMYVTVDVGDPNLPDGGLQPSEQLKDHPVTSKPPARAEVPIKAIFSKDNQRYVFVEKSPGKYARAAVQLGPERNGKVSVLEGLQPGERVVTEGALQLETLIESGKE